MYKKRSDRSSGGVKLRKTNPLAQEARSPEIFVFAKEILFEFGTLPLYPSEKIASRMLRQMVAYCKSSRSKKTLTLGAWYHMCKYKLDLSFTVGWIYIRLYDILFQQMNQTNRNGKWDYLCHKLKGKKYDVKGRFEVPTLKFMLFLFVQHAYCFMHKPQVRPLSAASATSDDEDTVYVEDSYEREFDMAVLEREEKRIINDEYQFRFIESHLPVMINYLETGGVVSSRIKMEIIDALDLIINVKRTFLRKVVIFSLKELIKLDGLADYDQASETVDRKLFIRLVRQSLQRNPWGPSDCNLKCPVPNVVTGLQDEVFCVHARRENRILRTEKLAPICWYTISHVSDQVLYLKDIPPHSCIRLLKCYRSYIYLVGAFSSVAIEWCENCTIFLGCVAGVIRLTTCKRIFLVAQVRQLLACETVLSAFQIHTPCSPILVGHQNTELYFGPYTSCYPNLEVDMATAKLGTKISQWDNVVGISYSGNPVDCEHQWSKIEGAMLFEFYFPFNLKGGTTRNPIKLQARHTWVLEKRQRNVERWTSTASLNKLFNQDKESVNIFRMILFRRFINYLIEHGIDQEIVGMCSYNEATCPRPYGQMHLLSIIDENAVPINPNSLKEVIDFFVTREHHRIQTYILPESEDETSRQSTPENEETST